MSPDEPVFRMDGIMASPIAISVVHCESVKLSPFGTGGKGLVRGAIKPVCWMDMAAISPRTDTRCPDLCAGVYIYAVREKQFKREADSSRSSSNVGVPSVNSN